MIYSAFNPTPTCSSEQLRDGWRAYIQGWWAYYRLAEDRQNIFDTESWIRRHLRCCFWQRWHNSRGRLRHLRRLDVRGTTVALCSEFRWSLEPGAQRCRPPSTEQPETATTRFCYAIRPCGDDMTAAFNRRMRKTARTVLWEGGEAQSSSPDPIAH